MFDIESFLGDQQSHCVWQQICGGIILWHKFSPHGHGTNPHESPHLEMHHWLASVIIIPVLDPLCQNPLYSSPGKLGQIA